MHKYHWLSLVAVALLLFSTRAPGDPGVLPAACEAKLADIPGWKTAQLPTVIDARMQSVGNSVVAAGDFDGNGEMDYAVIGKEGERSSIAVCLGNGDKKQLRRIRGHCHDVVGTLPAHSRVHRWGSAKVTENDADLFVIYCVSTSERRAFTYGTESFDSFLY